jgi:hypothetical protein
VDTLSSILPALARLNTVPYTPPLCDGVCLREGEILAARVHELQRQVPTLTRGEGALDYAFDRYEPVRGRSRAGHAPIPTLLTGKNIYCTLCSRSSGAPPQPNRNLESNFPEGNLTRDSRSRTSRRVAGLRPYSEKCEVKAPEGNVGRGPARGHQ